MNTGSGSATPPANASGRPSPTRGAFEVLEELLALMHGGLDLAMRDFALPTPYGHALAKIEGRSITMKELGLRLRCDPSFVTAIADVLEEKGLARREIDQSDRRVKNLVLTPRGQEARAILQREFYENLPGIRRLSEAERGEFVALLRKMIEAEKASGPAGPGAGTASSVDQG
jgi:DNA-binding MarR family transcriptional regulator